MRLQELKLLVADQNHDIDDLVKLMELTIEDLLDRFPDKLIESQHNFGVLEHED